MEQTIQMQMKNKARLARGFLNVLVHDVEDVIKDSNSGDFIKLLDSTKLARETAKDLTDALFALECLIYILDKNE